MCGCCTEFHVHQDTSNVAKPKADQECEKIHSGCRCIHRFMCMQIPVCVHVSGAQRSTLGIFPHIPFTLFYENRCSHCPALTISVKLEPPVICTLHTGRTSTAFYPGPGDGSLVLTFVWWVFSWLGYHTSPTELHSSVSHTELCCHEGEGKRTLRRRNPVWIIGSGILSE